MDDESNEAAGHASGPAALWCPSCVGPIAQELQCPQCGFPQDGADPHRLRIVRSQLHVLGERRRELTEEIAGLEDERVRLTETLWARSAAGDPSRLWAGTPRDSTAPILVRWGPERVRDSLLWLGATLLALAALTFVVVAWTRLAPEVRAAVLVGTTAVAGITAVLLRRRLRPTAEAIMALAGALLIVDWFALARAGVGPGADAASWWALGCGVVAAVSLAGSLRVDLQILRIYPAVLVPAAGAFAVVAYVHSAVVGALALSGLGVVLVLGVRLMAGRDGWRIAAAILRVAAVAATGGAAISAAVAVANIDDGVAIPAALAVLSVGLPAAVVMMVGPVRTSIGSDGVLGAVVTLAVIGAVVTALSAVVGAPGLFVLAAGFGVGGLALARRVPKPIAAGVGFTALVAIGIPCAAAAGAYTAALFGSWHWWSDPWSGSVSVTALASLEPGARRMMGEWSNGGLGQAGAIAIAASGGALLLRRAAVGPDRTARIHPLHPVAAAGLPVALATVTMGTSIGVILLVLGATMLGLLSAGVLGRDRERGWSSGALLAASVLALPLAGWSVVDERGSVLMVGALAATAFALRWFVLGESLRRWLTGAATLIAMVEVGVVALSVTERRGPAGLAITVAAAVVLVGVRLGRRAAPWGPTHQLLEAVGTAGVAAGVLMTTAGAFNVTVWSAHSLTVAMIALGLSGLRTEHAAAYFEAAGVTAILVVGAWLAVADVTIVEAYTLPAAAILVGMGIARSFRMASVGSWSAYGIGLIVGFGPSLAIALATGGALRPLILVVTAFVAVGLGARSRLQAPIAIGSATLIALAVEGVAPVAAAIPRWVLLGTVGVVVLWLGASADRRLAQLHRFRGTLDRLT